jgi:hypothetical protein
MSVSVYHIRDIGFLPGSRLQRGGDFGVDAIVGIAGAITAVATACAAVVGLMRMWQRNSPPAAGDPEPAAEPTPTPTPARQGWTGSDRPPTPPTPKPNPSATSWYQHVPSVPGNSWQPATDLPDAAPAAPAPEVGEANRWWHAGQSGDRVRTGGGND